MTYSLTCKDVLVSSIRCAKRLEDLNTEEVADLFQTVVKVQKVMESVYKSSSSTICVQDGKFAGQTIPVIYYPRFFIISSDWFRYFSMYIVMYYPGNRVILKIMMMYICT